MVKNAKGLFARVGRDTDFDMDQVTICIPDFRISASGFYNKSET